MSAEHRFQCQQVLLGPNQPDATFLSKEVGDFGYAPHNGYGIIAACFLFPPRQKSSTCTLNLLEHHTDSSFPPPQDDVYHRCRYSFITDFLSGIQGGFVSFRVPSCSHDGITSVGFPSDSSKFAVASLYRTIGVWAVPEGDYPAPIYCR